MTPAPAHRVRARCGLPPWLSLYLLTVLGLAAPAPVVSAQTQTVSEIQVTPETMTLGVGQKQALFAAAYDARGNLIASAKFTFWSSDSLIARVRKDGTVLGVTPGLAKIEARSQGRRASMAVLITGSGPADAPGPAVSAASALTVDPPAAGLFPGEAIRVTARVLRADGTPGPAARVSWRSLRPEVASVDSAGIIRGVTPGHAVVQASLGNRLTATLPVDVGDPDFILSRSTLTLGPEETDTLRAVVPNQGNREIRGALQWRSSDTSVVTVGPSGIVHARAPGQAEIVAAGFSRERRATVSVHQTPEALVVSPYHSVGPVQVPLRSSRKFTAVAEAADSTPIPEARISWELGDTVVAAFDPASGVLRPKAVGTTTLTARLAGIQPAVWTIQVTTGQIGVEPARVGLAPGQRTTLAAFLRDEQSAAAGRASGVRWSSDRPEVASAREGGVVDALAPGRAQITATTPWGKSASAEVFVVGDLLLTSSRAGNLGIFQTRTAAPSSLVPLLQDSASNIQAALSPDRTRIAFSSNRAGSFDLYLMDGDGRNVRRLTTDSGNEGEPGWTPNGGQIVYTITRSGTPQIAILPLDGNESRPLTATRVGNQSAVVSPDGRSIAFVSGRDGNPEIYAMDLDGTNQRRLTKTSVRESSPHFFRNGDLAYLVERGGRSKGSTILRLPWGGSLASPVLQSDDPITSFAVSREGDRLAYVVGRSLDGSKGRVDFSFFLQSTAPGSPPVPVLLKLGEQILTPSF